MLHVSFSHTFCSFSYVLFFANSTSYKVYTIVCFARIISIYCITLFCNCRCIFRYIICNSSTAKTFFIVVCHCCFFTVISLCRAFIFTVFTFIFTVISLCRDFLTVFSLLFHFVEFFFTFFTYFIHFFISLY